MRLTIPIHVYKEVTHKSRYVQARIWYALIEKIEKFGKPFTQLTKETVNGFLKDSQKSKFSIS